MDTSLGNLVATLALKTKGWTRGISKAQKDLGKLDVSLSSLGRGAAVMGALAAAGLGVSIKAAADLEKSVASAAAMTRLGQGNFAAFKQAAIDASKGSAFASREMGDALRFMSMAGISAQDSMSGLPDVASLATAAMTDLGKAADVSSNIMTAFGKGASDLAHINDILIGTTTSTNVSFDQMAESMKEAAGSAKATGQSLEATAAAIGQMGNAGIQGSKAGTSLKTGMLRLIAPTNKASESMKRLKLDMVDAEGGMVSIQEVVRQLEVAQDQYGSNTAAFAGDMAKVLGKEAVVGWQALLAGGSEALGGLTTQLQQTQGVAKSVESQMLDTLSGATQVLKGNLENLAATFGDKLTPYVKALAEVMTTLTVKWTKGAQGATGLDAAVRGLATGLAAALDGLSATMKVLGFFAKAWIVATAPFKNFLHITTAVTTGLLAMSEAMQGNSQNAQRFAQAAVEEGKKAVDMFGRMGREMDAVDGISNELSGAADTLRLALAGVNTQSSQATKGMGALTASLAQQRAFIDQTKASWDGLVQSYSSGGLSGLLGDAIGGAAKFAGRAPKKPKAITPPKTPGLGGGGGARDLKLRLKVLAQTQALSLRIAATSDATSKAYLEQQLTLQTAKIRGLKGDEMRVEIAQAELTLRQKLVAVEISTRKARLTTLDKELKSSAKLMATQMADVVKLEDYRQRRAIDRIQDETKRAKALMDYKMKLADGDKGLSEAGRTLVKERARDEHSSTTNEVKKSVQQAEHEAGLEMRTKLVDGAAKFTAGLEATLASVGGKAGGVLGKSLTAGMDKFTKHIVSQIPTGKLKGFSTEFSKFTSELSSAASKMDVGAIKGMDFGSILSQGKDLLSDVDFASAAMSGGMSAAAELGMGMVNMAMDAITSHEKFAEIQAALSQGMSDMLGDTDLVGGMLGSFEGAIGAILTVMEALAPLKDLFGMGDIWETVGKGIFSSTKMLIGSVVSIGVNITSAATMILSIASGLTGFIKSAMHKVAAWVNPVIWGELDTSWIDNMHDRTTGMAASAQSANDAFKNAQDALDGLTYESAKEVYEETKNRAKLNEQLKEGLKNGPSGYKMALARFQETQRAGASRGMGVSGLMAPSSGTNIQNLYIVAHDYDDFQAQMTRKAYRTTGTTQQQVASQVVQSTSRRSG